MYQFTYNGLTLQNDANTSINKLEGISRIPLRISEDPLTGGHGGNIWERRFDMRPITIGGFVYADDFATYYIKRNALLTAFSITPTSNNLIVTRPDGVQKSILAKVIDIPVFNESEGEFSSCQFEIVLKGEDPFWQSTITTVQTCGLALYGGAPIAITIPMPLSTLTGNTITIVNNGDVAGKVVFKIANSVVNPTVTNTTTGKSFSIQTTLVDGETITVYKDNTGQYVEKSDDGSLYSSFVGTIFDIVPGTNVIAFTAQTYTATATLEIDFTEKYITF